MLKDLLDIHPIATPSLTLFYIHNTIKTPDATHILDVLYTYPKNAPKTPIKSVYPTF